MLVMGRSRYAWALVILAAGSTGAGATRLDKSACNDLKTELAGVVASGARDDMERGPEWAKANLAPAKLADVRRLIELEQQLEFRCGIQRSRIVSMSPADNPRPQHSHDKVVAPERPARKPQSKSNAAKLAPTLVASPKPTLDAKKPAPTPAASPKAALDAKKPAVQKAASATATKSASAAPVGVSAAAPPPASSPKSQRRESSAAYVSPTDVNPYFVTRFGDAQ